MTNKNAYAQSGVDVEAGCEAVEWIKTCGPYGTCWCHGSSLVVLVACLTFQNRCQRARFDLRYRWFGTKLMLAIKFDKHDTIGQDCVAMCVNDVIAAGAEPLYPRLYRNW